jgi:hypothetical protein
MRWQRFIHLLEVVNFSRIETHSYLHSNDLHSVAVLAFKAIVMLELKRRENDQKVIALKMQIQDTMEVLLQ